LSGSVLTCFLLLPRPLSDVVELFPRVLLLPSASEPTRRTATVTTIGYGDITPRNTRERCYTVIVMFMGAACFAYVITNVASLVSELSVNSMYHRTQMDQLSDYARLRKLPSSLAFDIRRYFQHRYERLRIANEKQLLDAMSPDLRAQVMAYTYGKALSRATLLRDLPPAALAAVCSQARELFFRPDELVYRVGDTADALYVLMHGEATLEIPDDRGDRDRSTGSEGGMDAFDDRLGLYGAGAGSSTSRGRASRDGADGGGGGGGGEGGDFSARSTSGRSDSVVQLRVGDVFGEDELLFSRPRTMQAVCGTYCEIAAVSREAVLATLSDYPDVLAVHRGEEAARLWVRAINIAEDQVRFWHLARRIRAAAVARSATRARHGGAVSGSAGVPLTTLPAAATSLAAAAAAMATHPASHPVRDGRNGGGGGDGSGGDGGKTASGSGLRAAARSSAVANANGTADGGDGGGGGGGHGSRVAAGEADVTALRGALRSRDERIAALEAQLGTLNSHLSAMATATGAAVGAKGGEGSAPARRGAH